jgi:quercetin dioxygenase-like cupin family protein
MQLYEWCQIELEQLNPLMTRQVIHGERITIARLQFRKGAVVHEHSHGNEQITMLEQGKLLFTIDGEQKTLLAGQALQIPSNAVHKVEVLEDSLAMDVFSPVREDWIRGDDSYLRR